MLEQLKTIMEKYIETRKELISNWTYEFDTEDNRKIMNYQIKEIDNYYITKLREKKLDILLNDTIPRK